MRGQSVICSWKTLYLAFFGYEGGLIQTEVPGEIEGDNEKESLTLEDFGELEKRGIFARYHNSIVGYLGAERTLKALSLVGLVCIETSLG